MPCLKVSAMRGAEPKPLQVSATKGMASNRPPVTMTVHEATTVGELKSIIQQRMGKCSFGLF